MGRALLICLIGATAAGGAAAVAGAAAPPPAALESPICTQASDPLDRVVAITAVMRPRSGTERMELRFELLKEPRGRHSYSEVSGGDLGKWISPQNPTLGQRANDVWTLRKLVVNLAAPVVYRFHVGFRWTGAHGRVLGRQFLWAPACNER